MVARIIRGGHDGDVIGDIILVVGMRGDEDGVASEPGVASRREVGHQLGVDMDDVGVEALQRAGEYREGRELDEAVLLGNG